MHKNLAYRPDIDGLRALAVVLVVGYHAFPDTLKAGFIGVDIFFVISGYLIGGIILLNLQANDFSYRNFYYRRILRIFPALILVFLGVVIAGYICLLPDELKSLGSYVLAGGLFGENFLLWHSTGYFDTAAQAKPLLNLWSLGIEEQFYIIFPLLLLFCWKKRLRIFTILAILALLSLADCVWLRGLDPAADFYSPLTRFWELFAGCMLKAAEMSPAYGRVREKINKIISRIFYRDITEWQDGLGLLLALCGFFVLGFALVRITQQSWYPGWLALFPVCTALFLVGAGQSNLISRYFLSNRAAVFIGKISYPLYLWHWPMLSFAWIINGHLDASTRVLRVALVLAAFLLASLTYWLVERPIRLKRCLGRASMPILIGGMAFCCGLGFCLQFGQGFPDRANMRAFSEMKRSLSGDPTLFNEAGLKYTATQPKEFSFCKYRDAGKNETLVIYGDSHAHAAYAGIAKLGEQLANSGDGNGFNTLCLGSNGVNILKSESFKKFLKVLSQHPEIKKVVMINVGMALITGIDNRVDNNRGLNNPARGIGTEKFKRILEERIAELVKMGKEVVVVAENPELNHDIRSAIKRGFKGISIDHDRLKLSKKEVLKWERPYLDVLNQLGKIPGVEILHSIDTFCPGQECLAFDKNGLSLYHDDDHLSINGSDFQAQRIIRPWIEKKRKEKSSGQSENKAKL